MTSLRLLEEAETQAILAAAGDPDAIETLEHLIGALQTLQDELRREFPAEPEADG